MTLSLTVTDDDDLRFKLNIPSDRYTFLTKELNKGIINHKKSQTHLNSIIKRCKLEDIIETYLENHVNLAIKSGIKETENNYFTKTISDGLADFFNMTPYSKFKIEVRDDNTGFSQKVTLSKGDYEILSKAAEIEKLKLRHFIIDRVILDGLNKTEKAFRQDIKRNHYYKYRVPC